MNTNTAIDLVLGGFSLSEAIDLSEATITPETIDDFVNSRAFKGLEKNIELMYRDLESNEDYKRGRFTEDPIEALNDEAENAEYVANILNSLDIQGYDPQVKERAKSIAASLKKGANTIRNKVKKLSREDFIGDDGQLKMRQVKDKEGNLVYTKATKNEPSRPKMERDYPFGENVYTKRAIEGIEEIFKLLGIPWDYTMDFIKYLNAPLKKNEVPESVQKDIIHVIASAKAKGYTDKDSLKEALELTKEEEEFFEKVWIEGNN